MPPQYLYSVLLHVEFLLSFKYLYFKINLVVINYDFYFQYCKTVQFLFMSFMLILDFLLLCIIVNDCN